MRRLSLGAMVAMTVIATLLAVAGHSPAVAQRPEPMPTKTIHTSPLANATQTLCPGGTMPTDEEVPVYTYEVVNAWPHDPKAFTQGLDFYDGNLYESTGHHGMSSLRKVELKTGKVKKKYNVAAEYFAEGITIFQGRVYQLTWQSHKCFIYDLKSFDLIGEFHHDGEGWGLTNDEKFLIASDGTNQLRFLDPHTFLPVRVIRIFDHQQPLLDLNELEYIKGEIFANVWHSDRIVRIDPATGHINGWIDLTGLRPADVEDDTDNVLNGIAYDAKEDRLFVTGKRWTKLFEIRLKRK